MSQQPLNEAYHNEVLEAYQKISDNFDDVTQHFRKRIPFELLPEHCKRFIVNNYENEKNGIKSVEFPNRVSVQESISVQKTIGCDPKGKKVLASIDPINKPQIPIESHNRPKENPLNEVVIKRLEDLGRAQEKLKIILDSDIFNGLSKHNSFWFAETEKDADKLDDIRLQLSCLSDNLWDVWAILKSDD